ncbi:MAG TPA: hypothetical protein VK862_00565 [Afifellaceae bacterium]|nr:hypothetical protein [Afifellaceae bacterium]
MKSSIIGSLVVLLLSITWSVADEGRARVFNADAFLTDCAKAADQGICRSEQARWLDEVEKAFNGKVQPRIEVAECLRTGCAGAVTVDIFEACTWIALYSWESPSQHLDKADRSIMGPLFLKTCGLPVHNYTAILAANSANHIYEYLYGKKYPVGLF